MAILSIQKTEEYHLPETPKPKRKKVIALTQPNIIREKSEEALILVELQ